mgnify:CR=1 FL=1
MIASLLLLAAGVQVALGMDPWPLSVGISRAAPFHIALAMLACVLLAEACRQATGASRSLLATTCVMLPLIPVTSPYDALHKATWIAIVLCGSTAWLCQDRARAWLVAGMAWSVWLADLTGCGDLGGDAQVIVIAGLALGVLVLGRNPAC